MAQLLVCFRGHARAGKGTDIRLLVFALSKLFPHWLFFLLIELLRLVWALNPTGQMPSITVREPQPAMHVPSADLFLFLRIFQ